MRTAGSLQRTGTFGLTPPPGKRWSPHLGRSPPRHWTPLRNWCYAASPTRESRLQIILLARIVIENYNLWEHRHGHPQDASSILYDTAAVYLAYSEEYGVIETRKLIVDDKGNTLIRPNGKEVRCQLGWKDRKAFDAFLVKTLTESPQGEAFCPTGTGPGRVEWQAARSPRVVVGIRSRGFHGAPAGSHQLESQAADSRPATLAWITRPLNGVSDQEIVFEAGTELVALKGAYRATSDCLLSFRECENVVVRGAQPESRQVGPHPHAQRGLSIGRL